MAVDDSKTLFSSNWDVNQIVAGNTVTVVVPAYAIGNPRVQVADISSLGLASAPSVLAKIREVGSNTWFAPGGGLYFSGFTNGPLVNIVVTPTAIYADRQVASSITVEIEYYVLTRNASS